MPNAAITLGRPRGDLLGAIMANPGPEVYVATEILRPKATPRLKGLLSKVPTGAMTPKVKTKRSAKSGFNRTDWEMGEVSYKLEQHGHEEPWDRVEAEDWEEDIDYQRILARRAHNIIKISQECRVRDLIHDTNTYPLDGVTGLSISNEWDDATNADPKGDIQVGRTQIRKRSGLMPNCLQIPWRTWFDLWNCDQVKQSRVNIEYDDTPLPEDQGARSKLAALLGLKKIIVCSQHYTTDAYNPDQQDITEIWSNEYAFMWYDSGSDDHAMPAVGWTFNKPSAGGVMQIEEYEEPQTHSMVYRARQVIQEKLTMPECGFLFGNVTT